MRTENDLKTILQILIQKEKEEQQYIDKKISDFFKLLFSDLVIKDNKENSIFILEDGETNEEYIAYYNQLLNGYHFQKNKILKIEDFLGQTKEIILNKSTQYLFTIKEGILRIDILNSYTDEDMITHLYYVDDLVSFLNKEYKSIWELVTSKEFQTKTKPFITIVSELRANINGLPKDQTIYTIGDKKEFVLHARVDKKEGIDINPFLNHNTVVTNALRLEDYQRTRKVN